MAVVRVNILLVLSCVFICTEAQPSIRLTSSPCSREDNFINIDTTVYYRCETNGTRISWVISGEVSFADGLSLLSTSTIGDSVAVNEFMITVTGTMPFSTMLTVDPSHNLTNSTIECLTTNGVKASLQYILIEPAMNVSLSPRQDNSGSFGTFGRGTASIVWISPEPKFGVVMYEITVANTNRTMMTLNPSVDLLMPHGTHLVNITPINVFGHRGMSHPLNIVIDLDTDVIVGVSVPSTLGIVITCGLAGVSASHVVLYIRYRNLLKKKEKENIGLN